VPVTKLRCDVHAALSAAGVVASAAMQWSCGRVTDETIEGETLDSIVDTPDVGVDGIESETTLDATTLEVETTSDVLPTDGAKTCTLDGGECSAAEYCNAPKCASGTCDPRPTTPSTDFAPVCGCDVVTYWNADQAAARGVSVGRTGNCGTDTPGPGSCGPFYGSPPCPTGTVCVMYFRASCGSGDYGGHCWFIPAAATCPSDGGGYRDCTTSTCTNFCGAIENRGIHADGTCPA